MTPIGYERRAGVDRPATGHHRGSHERETGTIPIVFVMGSDPVGSGLVPELNRPDGNSTGFADFEASMGGKWLELLLAIAPGLKRVAIMFNPDTAPVSVYMPSFETAVLSLKSCQSLRPFVTTQRSKRPSSPSGGSREAALSCRIYSRPCIAWRSYRRKRRTGGLLPI